MLTSWMRASALVALVFAPTSMHASSPKVPAEPPLTKPVLLRVDYQPRKEPAQMESWVRAWPRSTDAKPLLRVTVRGPCKPKRLKLELGCWSVELHAPQWEVHVPSEALNAAHGDAWVPFWEDECGNLMTQGRSHGPACSERK